MVSQLAVLPVLHVVLYVVIFHVLKEINTTAQVKLCKGNILVQSENMWCDVLNRKNIDF